MAILGLLIALRGDRRIGLITAGAALVWFFVWIAALFPLLNDGKVQNEALYADVGGSPGGVVRTAFSHPSRLGSRLVSHESADYAWKLLAPFGLLSLAAPLLLLLGAPQAFLNLITNVPWTKTITFHYAALPFAAVTIAAVEGVAFLARRIRWRGAAGFLAAGVLACSFAATIAWGPSPIGEEYRDGEWALIARPQLHERARGGRQGSRRQRGERDVQRRAASHTPRGDLLVTEPVGVEELWYRRRAAPQRQARRVDRRRQRRARPANQRVAAGLPRPRDVPRACSSRTTTACSVARNDEAIAVRRPPRSSRGHRRFAGRAAPRARSRCS